MNIGLKLRILTFMPNWYYKLTLTIVSLPANKTPFQNLKYIYKEVTQEEEKNLISLKLEENKIKHIFLKGCVIKYLYPSVHLRSMADLDILVEEKYLKTISQIMKSIGYTVENTGGNHDVFYKNPFMNVEMHRNMIDEVYLYSKYYEDIWNKLKKQADKEYEYYLTDEDYYIYMMTHMAKHFSNGGTGIRSIVDEYIYLKHKEDKLDWDYIYREFEKLNLLEFSKNIKSLAYVWFKDKESNERFDLITEYILSSGTYGITTNSMIVKGFMDEDADKPLKKNKLKFLLTNMFPPYKQMKRLFPRVGKIWILLPFLWIIRLFKIVIFRRKRIKEVYKDINEVQMDDVNKVKQIHELSGIRVKGEEDEN